MPKLFSSGSITPSRRAEGHTDLSYVYAAAAEVARVAAGPLILVIKSTVPVGAGDEVERIASLSVETCYLSGGEIGG
jgi:UDP-glucose 6-dehydrogenase